MSTGQVSSYDELPYSDHCFPYTHPDYLETIGAIYGLQAPPADRCRVLELGCAGGGNLIPMALELPEARFVGLDLSPRQVEAGQAVIGKLGLRNIELRAMSITDVDDAFGRFDYIVCHGVYSWVPEGVRDKILAICAENLSENGIAYISYNTYPGWHARGMVREMLAFHVRRSGPALDRVQQAREFLEEMVRVVPDKSSAYARILRTEGDFIRGVANSYLFHEHLEETNHPFYFHEFMAQASAKGLGFLAEARTPGLIDQLPPDAKALVERWSEDSTAAEQYGDFLCNRTFRRTLLCHDRASRNRAPSAEVLSSLWLTSSLQPVNPDPDVGSSVREEFRVPEATATLSTDKPLLKAALVVLRKSGPRALTFDALWDRTQSLLSQVRATPPEEPDDPALLREALLRGFMTNLVDLHIHPPQFAMEVSERPLASALARLQAEDSGRVTNLRRRTVELEEFDRLVLRTLDGSKDGPAILGSLMNLAEADEFTIYEGDQPIRDLARIEAMMAAELENALRRLAGFALLLR